MKPGLILLAVLCVLPGCVTPPAPPLPTVQWDNYEQAKQILIAQQGTVDSVQAQLKIRFTSPPPKAQTNTFDAAVVMRGEDHFRLRAWKLNQTIFDLTVTPDGTFVVVIDEMKDNAPDAVSDMAELSHNLGAMLRGPDYRDARLIPSVAMSIEPEGFQDLGLWLFWPDDSILASLDSRTLAPAQWQINADSPKETLRLETRYADYAGQRWFERVVATGDFGRFEMTFRDVELNGELNPRAFQPPRRAVRVDQTQTLEKASP